MSIHYQDESVTLHHGDCLDVLRGIPDASIDAVVCDPPYSLTDRREQYCASDMLRDAIVEDAQHSDSERRENLVTLRVTVAPTLAMSVRRVHLDRDVSPGQEEVEDSGPTAREGDDVLVNGGDAVPSEQIAGGEFRLWVRQGATRCISVCRCLGKGGDGRIRVPVRLRDDSARQAERAPRVVALGGAEVAAVLALDVTGRSGELLPASGADTLDPAFELLCPEGVGAIAGAGGLSAVAESGGVGGVGGPASGALAFDLLAHRSVLSWSPSTLRGFMSNLWDGTGIETDTRLWRECLRVLKPGGHCIAFGSPRTWHNLQTAIERSGFEIRDGIAWLTGSGFPKSLDVSKAIDKAAGAEREVVGAYVGPDGKPRAHSITAADFRSRAYQEAQGYRPSGGEYPGEAKNGQPRDITAPATPDAEQWQGWGTALKPAWESVVVGRKPPALTSGTPHDSQAEGANRLEPIVVGRKPLDGNVAANVLRHGTGALNVDGCRIATDEDTGRAQGTDIRGGNYVLGAAKSEYVSQSHPSGRWPTNVVLDGHQADELDEQSGESVSQRSVRVKPGGVIGNGHTHGTFVASEANVGGFDDTGGASRFFPVFRYEAKAPTSQRPKVDGVAHPTVKPLDLMRWLVRLVTPPGGTVLEPFAGSGTTVEACVIEGFKCVAIEKTDEYLPLTVARIHRQRNPVEAIRLAGDDLGLFDLGEETA